LGADPAFCTPQFLLLFIICTPPVWLFFLAYSKSTYLTNDLFKLFWLFWFVLISFFMIVVFISCFSLLIKLFFSVINFLAYFQKHLLEQ
jgi:hypothetical protein